MRKKSPVGPVTLQAIAGNNAVYFGFDLDADARKECLGFAIHRTDHTSQPIEQYWLAGFKTFGSVVPIPDRTQVYSSRDHPLQTFYWGDYTAKPGHRYTYRLVPRYGSPKNLLDHPGVEASVDISTSDPAHGTHGVYFNRGIAASQAYAHRFGAPPPKLTPTRQAEAMAWLSRGLAEAIVAFIEQASSAGWALRAAVYEFTEPSVLAAFGKAHAAGADVRIVYHATGSAGTSNNKAIAAAGLDLATLTPRTRATIAHNKFIVLCRRQAGGQLTPVAVWTGSTNLSRGGVFGHSNVGHVVRDPIVAARFLDYWGQLVGDPDKDALQDWVSANSPFAPGALTAPGIHALFSPRHGLAPLRWYADSFGTAGVVATITEAFGMNKTFEDALIAASGDALHYVLLDRKDDNQDAWSATRRVFVAVGTLGGPSSLSAWAKEALSGFNPLVKYLHTKVLLVDPLGLDPTVITGSANFSPASTYTNDENMLIIRGDREVADVYVTETARIFSHLYARYWAHKLSAGAANADDHSFLDETAAWQESYFIAGNPKQFQRILFSSKVEGNV